MPLVPTKPKAKSKTLWLFGAQLTAAIVALILHYTDAVPLGPGMLATSLVAVLMGLQGVVLRLVTREPVKRAKSAATVITSVVLLLPLGGCGASLEHAAEKAGTCLARCAMDCGYQMAQDLVCPVPPPKKDVTPVEEPE